MCNIVLLAACVAATAIAGAGNVQPDGNESHAAKGPADAREAVDPKAPPPALEQAQRKPQDEVRLPKWRRKLGQFEEDGRVIWRPEGEGRALPGDDREPVRPHQFPHGRARALTQLAEGDPFAWSIVGGIVGAIPLALVVAALLRWRRTKADAVAAPDPAGIIRAWQKRRAVCLASAWTILPLGFVLMVFVIVTWEEPLAPLVTLLPAFFLVFVISFTDWRCPACGRGMGHNTNPKFCPKCGVQLGED